MLPDVTRTWRGVRVGSRPPPALGAGPPDVTIGPAAAPATTSTGTMSWLTPETSLRWAISSACPWVTGRKSDGIYAPVSPTIRPYSSLRMDTVAARPLVASGAANGCCKRNNVRKTPVKKAANTQGKTSIASAIAQPSTSGMKNPSATTSNVCGAPSLFVARQIMRSFRKIFTGRGASTGAMLRWIFGSGCRLSMTRV